MKQIKTLVKDIYDRLTSAEPFPEDTVQVFATNLAKKLANRLSERKGNPSLRMSNLGTNCDRKLWYSIHCAELAEPLSGANRLKFLFGDIIEEVILFLARASGHRVEREQEEVKVNGVKGHLDGFIDDELVDVKSCSTPSFNKFNEHGLMGNDPFGYLTQLGGYGFATGQSTGHFLAIDKTLGNICLDTWKLSGKDYNKVVEQKRDMLNGPLPDRYFTDMKDGESGNRKLCMECSYCDFKRTCWPGLKLFAYARPRFLTTVVRQPDVPQIW